ncbi:Stk1 family PASTA domain-containing Ser/Thr kinase [Streptomyces caniscabiei]|uniref:non-specific serine/threonine protein kinase n=1 Tax=Streptomyces caniscabiei TaxID=2746961 RepID=A0A927L6J0_9ACTN|nr:Stk1 family PASTA domain-containing Ser/Thr kinase [Streptomyces caniscabiei]MBD9725736.1 Stk1 family PASTA domain-containing Ser/Thr kinase [Streptomyces caniscabiei]MDX3510000.1 Stk1 family PASTA domain-containing Ser/Thr kinase [Streptomyces caniscabiei]MDX3720763.1 Stk1 family PASTA domain-containing Ser/Thr kinase [Streptomyces caniscabiei]MDX3729168.1 Stk1 family PASTA domain-containing Ser/Thr kinase [Streptomyces caniscabiei]WEO27623.1 Stk1 family PASTA domain-containing Ser/Thr kin
MDTTLQDPLVGQVLDGRYRVEARIAVGGMATVYRTVDTRLDRVLALKVMHPTLAADRTFVERFIREAKSVARLSHPNVVGVYDQGTDGSYVYLAMEYVAGCTLRDVLRERGALQPRAALDILEPVLAALGAAHRAGFVHRDMKPENVLIGDDGRVKVADFGLVRAVDTVTSTTGSVLGTVSYLAPEQLEHGTTDTRVDVYACGVMLYEMLTGGKPHAGDSPAQVLYHALHDAVPPPSAAVPGLPYELDELVASATARDPELRPYDAVALLAQTRHARAGLSDAQLDVMPPQAIADGHDSAEDRTSVIPRSLSVSRSVGLDPDDRLHRTSRFDSPPPPPRGARTSPAPRRGLWAIVVAMVLVLGVGGAVWYINSGQFTQVPAVLQQSEADATKRLEGAGLGVDVKQAFSDTVERGRVIGTDPAPGERIRDNDTVTVTVSKGPETVKVPDLKGTPLDAAKTRLKGDGLEPGVVTREFSDEVVRGQVIGTRPGAGTEISSGAAVRIVVSRGAPVEVPEVSGASVADARAQLEEAGLKVKVAPGRVNSEFDKGLVAEQAPGVGKQVGQGDTVTLTLSKGPVMVEVPDVVGDSVDDATRRLKDAGFEVEEDRGILGLFGDEVRSQSVDGGDTAPKGSTITIEIR